MHVVTLNVSWLLLILGSVHFYLFIFCLCHFIFIPGHISLLPERKENVPLCRCFKELLTCWNCQRVIDEQVRYGPCRTHLPFDAQAKLALELATPVVFYDLCDLLVLVLVIFSIVLSFFYYNSLHPWATKAVTYFTAGNVVSPPFSHMNMKNMQVFLPGWVLSYPDP